MRLIVNKADGPLRGRPRLFVVSTQAFAVGFARTLLLGRLNEARGNLELDLRRSEVRIGFLGDLLKALMRADQVFEFVDAFGFLLQAV